MQNKNSSLLGSWDMGDMAFFVYCSWTHSSAFRNIPGLSCGPWRKWIAQSHISHPQFSMEEECSNTPFTVHFPKHHVTISEQSLRSLMHCMCNEVWTYLGKKKKHLQSRVQLWTATKACESAISAKLCYWVQAIQCARLCLLFFF